MAFKNWLHLDLRPSTYYLVDYNLRLVRCGSVMVERVAGSAEERSRKWESHLAIPSAGNPGIMSVET